jgi:hypothetical protein
VAVVVAAAAGAAEAAAAAGIATRTCGRRRSDGTRLRPDPHAASLWRA